MTTTTVDDRTGDYLADVRAHLADLSDDERDDLADDLAVHLHEVSAHDDRPLEEVLGPPSAFAAELRAAAGLPATPRSGRLPGTERIRSLAAGLRTHRWTRAVRAFLPELRPAWWVARGVLLVLGLSLMTGGDPRVVPLPTPFGSLPLGLVAAGAAAVASVRLARRDTARWAVRTADGLAVVAALAALMTIVERAPARIEVLSDPGWAPTGQLTQPDGRAVSNIHAYRADGTLLEEVLLYDQDGVPVDVGHPEVDALGQPLETRYPLDAHGREIHNAYPLDQRTVAWDDAGQALETPVPPPAVALPPWPER